jgi:hypothetical protein
MHDVIFLVVDRTKVQRMTKSLPTLRRGEIPVKLNITVADGAFREPVLEREVEVTDWLDGIDLADVAFEHSVITEEEAAIIRAHRLERMRQILEGQGYTVTEPADEEEDDG